MHLQICWSYLSNLSAHVSLRLYPKHKRFINNIDAVKSNTYAYLPRDHLLNIDKCHYRFLTYGQVYKTTTNLTTPGAKCTHQQRKKEVYIKKQICNISNVLCHLSNGTLTPLSALTYHANCRLTTCTTGSSNCGSCNSILILNKMQQYQPSCIAINSPLPSSSRRKSTFQLRRNQRACLSSNQRRKYEGKYQMKNYAQK